MRFRVRREMKPTRIEIIPMIDTMFFLLVFFILAALNIIDLRGLNLNLPSSGVIKPPPKNSKDIKLLVKIDDVGNFTIQGKRASVFVPMNKDAGPLLLSEAKFAAQGQALDLAKVSVIISPQKDTPHQFVVKCMDDARYQKMSRFSIR